MFDVPLHVVGLLQASGSRAYCSSSQTSGSSLFTTSPLVGGSMRCIEVLAMGQLVGVFVAENGNTFRPSTISPG